MTLHHAESGDASRLDLDLTPFQKDGQCYGDYHRLPLDPMLKRLHVQARRAGLADASLETRDLMSHMALDEDHIVTQEISGRVWRYNVGYSETPSQLEPALDAFNERMLEEPLPSALARLTESWVYMPGQLDAGNAQRTEVLWMDKPARARYRLEQVQHWFRTLRDNAERLEGDWLAWHLTHLPLTQAPVIDSVDAFGKLARLDLGERQALGPLDFTRYQHGVCQEGMGLAITHLPRRLNALATLDDALVMHRGQVENVLARLDRALAD
ncbi:hypothetical protein [Chromohalobacter israelensis]|uniref:hypothetical protein n=1 Tax=Chromohalobacter israelensis TaxID=141390 RepID=UPI000FFE503E|nr:hypothetical protein [Chromohalobacter salexigens]RXE49303.1 hypothetical protein B4O83_15550 [Chromohalobacter salexigens]